MVALAVPTQEVKVARAAIAWREVIVLELGTSAMLCVAVVCERG